MQVYNRVTENVLSYRISKLSRAFVSLYYVLNIILFLHDFLITLHNIILKRQNPLVNLIILRLIATKMYNMYKMYRYFFK